MNGNHLVLELHSSIEEQAMQTIVAIFLIDRCMVFLIVEDILSIFYSVWPG